MENEDRYSLKNLINRFESHSKNFILKMENEDRYSLENLINRFESHSKNFMMNQKELIAKYPDRDKTFDNDFNMSLALSIICKEIKELKNGK